jgi:phosphatidylserine/phosphatidylglycerophosphate/cardiolipin synthase-like enzyme
VRVLVVVTVAVLSVALFVGSSVGAVGASVPGPDAPAGLPDRNVTDAPRIVAVFPDPIAAEDRGEFVVLALGNTTSNRRYTLGDGEDRVVVAASGTVAVSSVPAATRNLTDRPVVAGDLSLSNAGETLTLRRNGTGTVLDRVTYDGSEEGAFWRPPDGTGEGGWRPLGATDRPVATLDADRVETFVLPDSPEVVDRTLRSADRRILLAGYTFTDPRVTRRLRAAARRGVTVRVLVDDAPVGGVPERTAHSLDVLVAAGADVRVFGGDQAPYDFHHPKYAVVDDRALVLTENWKPAGTGGRSSRGWGVVVHGPTVADELAAVFRADAEGRGSRPWDRYRREATFQPTTPANGTYPTRVDPETVPVETVRVLVAPDNAESALARTVREADRSVRIEQVSVERGPLLSAAAKAAARGVEVRVLLSGAWYVATENRRMVAALNDRADRAGLTLTARVADPDGRFEKVHTKGVVVDGDEVAVGSLNWNTHSARENREVVVVLSGERVGAFFAKVFDADWDAGQGPLSGVPAGLAAALALVVLVAIIVAKRRIAFVDDPETEP